MDKKALIIIGVILVIGFGVGVWLYNTADSAREAGEKLVEPITEVTLPEGYLFFYGLECPHCQKVEEFLNSNDVANKMTYTKFEVWHNEENRNLMLQAAKNCQLKVKDVGVPFIYDGQQCIIGEMETINFFKEKAGIQ